MVTKFNYSENQFGKKEVQIESSDQTKPYKKRDRMQPLPGASNSEIVEWAKSLVYEAYVAKRDWHAIWVQQQYDYYCKPTYRNELEVGKDPNKGNRDTDVFIPPLIRRLVDLTACWLTRQIFRATPFIQFTNYKIEDKELASIQKLYERKLEGDSQKYRAREKSKQIFTDLALYGNAVIKADFSQERVLVDRAQLEVKTYNPLAPSEDDLFDTIDGYDDTESDNIDDFEVKTTNVKPYFEVIDQYAMFNPIYLANFFIDPAPRYGDWQNAAYMGDISYVNEEELYDMFGNTPSFKNGFLTTMGGYTSTRLPFGIGLDPFIAAQFPRGALLGRVNNAQWGRRIHSILYLETTKTQTCIIDETIVAFHKLRDPKVKKLGVWSYELLRFPVTTGGLWGVGYGSILKYLQKEQRYLASKRLQFLEKMHKPFIEVLDETVDESRIKEMKDCIMIRTTQPGGINFRLPPAGAEELYLNSEARNMVRAREYAGIPSMLDGSSDKTHMTGVPQRLEAAQVQFDVLLDIARDSFKSMYQKIHVLNMAYLDGDLPIYGSVGSAERNNAANSLLQSQLAKLQASDTVMELNAGVDVNSEKLKELAQLINTAAVQEMIQGLSPVYKQIFGGQLFDMSGNSEFKRIFELDAQDKLDQAQQQQAMAQAQGGMPGGMPGAAPNPQDPTGQIPMPSAPIPAGAAPPSAPNNMPPGIM